MLFYRIIKKLGELSKRIKAQHINSLIILIKHCDKMIKNLKDGKVKIS